MGQKVSWEGEEYDLDELSPGPGLSELRPKKPTAAKNFSEQLHRAIMSLGVYVPFAPKTTTRD